MARYLRSATIGTNDPKTSTLLIGASQTIVEGDILAIDATSKLGIVAVAASAALFAIAGASITTTASPTAADKIPVTLLKDAVVRIPFTAAGTKKTFASTDKYITKFDLADKNSVAPDDTTGGMCHILDYDNTALTCDVVFDDALLIIPFFVN